LKGSEAMRRLIQGFVDEWRLWTWAERACAVLGLTVGLPVILIAAMVHGVFLVFDATRNVVR